ncbi:hypothetical protein [Anaerofustis sp.]|uniref:hypothetical protein n=1 Tax=Anaerofustis sp. TaxID=1872517 RepID=UPI0025C5B4A9|nr:hypothetical protein [Anaerofustis sp.]
MSEKEILKEDDKVLDENEIKDNGDFHLDPTSDEDRKKIMESYKKSLRKRAFAPLIGGNVGINPIDLLKEEEAEKENDESLDMYDLMNKRFQDIEKKASQALSMARLAFIVSVAVFFMLLILLTVK